MDLKITYCNQNNAISQFMIKSPSNYNVLICFNTLDFYLFNYSVFLSPEEIRAILLKIQLVSSANLDQAGTLMDDDSHREMLINETRYWRTTDDSFDHVSCINSLQFSEECLKHRQPSTRYVKPQTRSH